MEIRGVSSTTAVRPTAFQPTESGSAGSASPVADGTSAMEAATDTAAEKASGPGYISPFLRYDQGARVAVLYFRDFDTGETQDQIPSQRVVEEYRRAAGRLLQEDERKSSSAAQTGTAAAASGSAAGTSGTGAGSALGGAGGGSGSTGVSFASVGGKASGGAGSAAPAGMPSPAGGLAAATAGGSFGGAPGGLVSMTV